MMDPALRIILISILNNPPEGGAWTREGVKGHADVEDDDPNDVDKGIDALIEEGRVEQQPGGGLTLRRPLKCACGRPAAAEVALTVAGYDVRWGSTGGTREVCGPECALKVLEAIAGDLRLNLCKPPAPVEFLAEAERKAEERGRVYERALTVEHLRGTKAATLFEAAEEIRRGEHRPEGAGAGRQSGSAKCGA